jgi:hypothetical protein
MPWGWSDECQRGQSCVLVPKNKKPQWLFRKAHHGLQIYAEAKDVSMTIDAGTFSCERVVQRLMLEQLQLDFLLPLYDRSDLVI